MFRRGDFFEVIEEDAELCARTFGLTLTHLDRTIPMTGIPSHSLEHYLRTLLTAGHRVAICEQVEEGDKPKHAKVERVIEQPGLF